MNSNFNIFKEFEKAAGRNPDKTAIAVISGREITFKELAAEVEKASRKLAEAGVVKKSKVLFLMPMSIEFYIVMLALVKIGAVVVIVDPWMGRDKIESVISAVEPGFFIGRLKAFLLFSLCRSFRRIKKKILVNSLIAGGGMPAAGVETAAVNESDPALITFTTGSTGKPKGIIRTHGVLFEQYQILCRLQNYDQDDVDLQPFPVFLLANLGRGNTSVIPWKKSRMWIP